MHQMKRASNIQKLTLLLMCFVFNNAAKKPLSVFCSYRLTEQPLWNQYTLVTGNLKIARAFAVMQRALFCGWGKQVSSQIKGNLSHHVLTILWLYTFLMYTSKHLWGGGGLSVCSLHYSRDEAI